MSAPTEASAWASGSAASEPTAPTGQPSPLASTGSALPSQLGRYRVLEPLGRGAMGVVLRAVDPELDRDVAIKLLHAPRASRGATAQSARLQREAQALARLSHPNVIEIYDVGVADGRVFIAMEYVRGPNLHAWLRERPPLHQIVDAFVQAGEGLAAAHAAGLVHRDFKPANVLRGADGRVRVADFGLAAPIRDDEEPTSPAAEGHVLDLRITMTGAVIGTPAYMSPEAHDGKPLDGKSDQWSFCASFYEALYGERPFRASDARQQAREVRRTAPRPPSDVDVPPRLRELVLRGLAVEPADRWPSMAALLDRLRPPRRRPRRWILGGTVATVGLAGLLLAPRHDDACEQAAAAMRESWSPEIRAGVEQAFLGSGAGFAEQTWQSIGTSLDAHVLELAEARRQACEASRMGDVAAEPLDRQVACLGRHASDLRGLVAVFSQADAATVRNAVKAVGGLRAPSDCEASGGTAPPPTIAAEVERIQDDMARVRTMIRTADYADARVLSTEVLAAATALDHPPLVAEARFLHGKVLMADGDYADAEPELVEARLAAEAVGDDPLVAKASTELAFLVGNRLRRPEDAERWVRHARAAIERLPEPTQAQIDLDGALGTVRQANGDFGAARGHYERALAATEAKLGPLHPDVLTLRSNVGLARYGQGDHALARELLLGVVADCISVYGPVHPEVSTVLGNLGVVEQVIGELQASAEHTQQALDGLEATVGQQHPLYPQLLTNLANTTHLLGRSEDALRMHERAVELLEQSLGPRAFVVGRSLVNIGTIHHRAHRNDEARRAYLRAYEIFEESLRPDHPDLGILLANIGHVDRDTGHYDEALARFDRGIALLEKAWGPAHPDLALPLSGRGYTQFRAGRPARALEDLLRSVALFEAAGIEPEGLARTRHSLAEAQWAAGERALARASMERVLAEAKALGDVGSSLAEGAAQWLVEHPAAE